MEVAENFKRKGIDLFTLWKTKDVRANSFKIPTRGKNQHFNSNIFVSFIFVFPKINNERRFFVKISVSHIKISCL